MRVLFYFNTRHSTIRVIIIIHDTYTLGHSDAGWPTYVIRQDGGILEHYEVHTLLAPNTPSISHLLPQPFFFFTPPETLLYPPHAPCPKVDKSIEPGREGEMASAIAALNAKIRSHPVLNYICSTRKLAYLHLPRLLLKPHGELFTYLPAPLFNPPSCIHYPKYPYSLCKLFIDILIVILHGRMFG